MKRSLALLAAAGLVATAATQATAEDYIPPVAVDDDGTCPSGYREVFRAGSFVVCVRLGSLPGVRPTTTGCNAGEWAATVDGRYGVCIY